MQDDIAQSVVKELRTTLLGDAAEATAEKAATAAVGAAPKGRKTDRGATTSIRRRDTSRLPVRCSHLSQPETTASLFPERDVVLLRGESLLRVGPAGFEPATKGL